MLRLEVFFSSQSGHGISPLWLEVRGQRSPQDTAVQMIKTENGQDWSDFGLV